MLELGLLRMSEPESLIGGASRRAAKAVVREAADIWSQGVRDLEPAAALAVFVHALSARSTRTESLTGGIRRRFFQSSAGGDSGRVA
jgi:hypothetical protein